MRYHSGAANTVMPMQEREKRGKTRQSSISPRKHGVKAKETEHTGSMVNCGGFPGDGLPPWLLGLEQEED